MSRQIKIPDVVDVQKFFDNPSSLSNLALYRIIEVNAIGRDNHLSTFDSCKYSSLCTNHFYAKEHSFIIPKSDNKVILLRNSISTFNVALGLDAHKNGKAYFTDAPSVEQFLELIGEKNYYIISAKESKQFVPTRKYSKSGVMKFLYQNQAEPYGLFLYECGIDETYNAMFVDNDNYANSYSLPFTNPIVLHKVGSFSDFTGPRDFNLNYLGVKRFSSDKRSAVQEVYVPKHLCDLIRSAN